MSETPEVSTQSPEERIAQLEHLVGELQLELKNKTENIMRELVQISARQIQMLFENPVMAGSIASNLLTAMQNALVFQASDSRNRKPVMLIVKDYVPKSMRLTLSEDGKLTLEQQEPNVIGEDAPWSLSPYGEDPNYAKVFVQLAQSFGVNPDQPVFAVSDLDLQEYRQSLTEQIQSNAARVDAGHAH